MARRVVIGQRGGEFGIFVSKPGFDALTDASANLLFGTKKHSMVIQEGAVAFGAVGASVIVPWTYPPPSLPIVVINFPNFGSRLGVCYVTPTHMDFRAEHANAVGVTVVYRALTRNL